MKFSNMCRVWLAMAVLFAGCRINDGLQSVADSIQRAGWKCR